SRWTELLPSAVDRQSEKRGRVECLRTTPRPPPTEMSQPPVNRSDRQVVLTSRAKRPTAESPTMNRQAFWRVYGPSSRRWGRVASAAQVGQGRSQSRPA